MEPIQAGVDDSILGYKGRTRFANAQVAVSAIGRCGLSFAFFCGFGQTLPESNSQRVHVFIYMYTYANARLELGGRK